MNYTKAQKEIFNELCSGSCHMGRFNVNEDFIFVSPDGYKAYIFPVSTIAFSLEKIREMKPIPILEVIKPENELKLTPDLRIADERRKLTIRRLKGNGKNTYVNVKFLDCFQNPKFYQDKSNLSAIVVTEQIGVRVGGHGSKAATYKECPVGLILPVRATWDDGSYYNNTME